MIKTKTQSLESGTKKPALSRLHKPPKPFSPGGGEGEKGKEKKGEQFEPQPRRRKA